MQESYGAGFNLDGVGVRAQVVGLEDGGAVVRGGGAELGGTFVSHVGLYGGGGNRGSGGG